MRRLLLSVAALSVWAAEAFEAHTYDFRKPEDLVACESAWHPSADGSSMRADAKVGASTFRLGDVDTQGAPFVLSWEARGFELADPAHHWGFTFTTAAGEQAFSWAQENVGFLRRITTARGTVVAEGGGGEPCMRRGKTGEDVAWTKVELICTADRYVLRLGPQVCYEGERSLLGIAGLVFHAYNESVEVRNLRLAPYASPPTDETPDPTFSAAGGAPGEWTVPNAVNSMVGGFRCWMRPSSRTDNLAFRRADGSEAASFSLYMWDWARACVRMKSAGLEPVTYRRLVPDIAQRCDEWFHVAFTWDERAKGRFIINGLPYTTGDSANEAVGLSLLDNALGEVAKIALSDDNVRDLVVWRRTLTTREVVEDYRRTMPLDCALTESLVPSDEPSAPVFRLAPGGTYVRPNPVEALSNVCAAVEVTSEIERIVELHERAWAPSELSGYRFEPVAGTRTAAKAYDVRGPVDIPAATATLAPGTYRIAVTVTRRDGASAPYVRHLFFTAAPRVGAVAKPRTKADVRKGEVVFSKTFGEPYLETDAAKDARFFAEVTFPADRLERPYLLEIDWPDDKPRAMGLYMYETADNTSRDHLQQGLVAGAEIPSSGRMQTASYLFYPATKDYLFEARTLIPGRPAAVRALRVYDLPDGLPALRVHAPEGLPGRTFGHCDEDQTFDNNLTSARLNAPTTEILKRLVDYFAYTGQNAFHFSVLRYATMNSGWLEGASRGGLFPRRQGELREVVRALGRNGIAFVPQDMYANDPTIARLGEIEGDDLAAGRVLLDNEGLVRELFARGRAPMDFRNAGEVARHFGTFMDMLRDLSTHGVSRTLMCVGNDIASPLAWPSWDYGTKDAPDWLAARCAPVTENVRRYAKAVTADNPALRVTVEVPAGQEAREMKGVDIEAISRIPNVDLAVIRDTSTRYWYDLFRIGSDGRSDALERAYGPQAAEDLRNLRRLSGGAVPVVYTYPTYFETFTLLPEGPYRTKYGNYFQDADVKPWGRHFLRELAFCLAETDMLNYAIGMQPLGSWGADEVVREFVQAYCALPALPFRDSVSEAPGVTARSLVTSRGTYFYLVNATPSNRTVRVTGPDLGEPPEVTDLSTDETRAGDVFALAPYQLRSFFVGESYPLSGVRDATDADVAATAVSFGGVGGEDGYDFTNEIVRVTVTDVRDGFAQGGYALRLTVRDAAGATRGVVTRPLEGAGTYAFDTGVSGALAPGASYTCEIALVTDAGEEVPLARRGAGAFRTAADDDWFSFDAGTDEARGGEWRLPPKRAGAAYAPANAEGCVFAAATSAADSFCSVASRVTFRQPCCECDRADALDRLRAEGAVCALLVGEREEDREQVWLGLVREGDAAVLRELSGTRALCGRAYEIVQEVDALSAKVSYLVDDGYGTVRLRDDSGATWFPCCGTGAFREAGYRGDIRIASAEGVCSDASVAEAGGVGYPTLAAALAAGSGEVRLRTNATWTPDRRGRWQVSGGYDLRVLAARGWRVTCRDGQLVSSATGTCFMIE